MTINYLTSGVCSRQISVEISDDGIIESVKFIGGCKGNTAGISALVKGMNARDVISRVENIRCGFKPTSCPDQLSKALKAMLGEN